MIAWRGYNRDDNGSEPDGSDSNNVSPWSAQQVRPAGAGDLLEHGAGELPDLGRRGT